LSSSNQSFHPSPSSFSVNLVNAPRRQSTTTEDVKELVRISDELERQLQERKSQVAQLEERIRSITNVLNQLGVLPEDSAARDMLGSLRTVVRNTSGHPVANIDVNPQLIRITPTGLMPIDTRKPPFRNFFIQRILRRMRDEDGDAVVQGKLSRESAFVFECREDRGLLVELVVRHYGTSQRLERIVDALNWTLDKQQGKRSYTT
jgi:hypothetical protein